MNDTPRQATPHPDLIAQLMDSRVPKTEREHAAAREIERLRGLLEDALLPGETVADLMGDVQRQGLEIERLRGLLREYLENDVTDEWEYDFLKRVREALFNE